MNDRGGQYCIHAHLATLVAAFAVNLNVTGILSSLGNTASDHAPTTGRPTDC